MNKMFYGLALSLMLCLVFVPAALADSPCANGTFSTASNTPPPDDYSSAGFTCSIGNLDFSNFVYSDSVTGTSTAIAGSNVNVLTETGPDGPGFNFQAGWQAAGAGSTNDVSVSFDVTALSGSLADVYIVLGSPTATNGGTALYTETFCETNTQVNGSNACGEYVEAPITPGTNVVSLVGSTAFPPGPVTSLSIVKDLDLNAGSNASGLAAVSLFGNQYSVSSVPEPRGISLVLGLGLLAGFVVFKRRRVAQS